MTSVYFIAASGRGANLLKPNSKRRRPKAQILEDKRRALAEKEEVERKLKELEELRLEHGKLLEKRQKVDEDVRLVEHLYD